MNNSSCSVASPPSPVLPSVVGRVFLEVTSPPRLHEPSSNTDETTTTSYICYPLLVLLPLEFFALLTLGPTGIYDHLFPSYKSAETSETFFFILVYGQPAAIYYCCCMEYRSYVSAAPIFDGVRMGKEHTLPSWYTRV